MKILFDKCVTKHLKHYLPHHEVFTVAEQAWSGFKNGQLMKVATAAGLIYYLPLIKMFSTNKILPNTLLW